MRVLGGRFAALVFLGVVVLAGCAAPADRAKFQRLRFAGRMLESTMKGEAVGMVVLEDRSFRQAIREFETELDIAKTAATDADRPIIAAYEDVQAKAKQALAQRTEEVNGMHEHGRVTTIMRMTPQERQTLEDALQRELEPGYRAVRAALDRAETLLN